MGAEAHSGERALCGGLSLKETNPLHARAGSSTDLSLSFLPGPCCGLLLTHRADHLPHLGVCELSENGNHL